MSFNLEKIQGTLLYVQLQEAVPAYVKTGAPPKPKEWKASVCIVDEDYADALEDYAKELDTQISLKKVKSAEFKEKYKCDLPDGAGKNVWVLTLRKSTELGKTGKPVPDMYHPKVYLKEGKVLKDVTSTVLVGNGSKGAISIDRFDRTTNGSSLYLKNVLVTDLVEYEAKASDYQAGSEFDDDADDGDGGTVKVPAKAVAKAAKKAPEPSVDDDDVPF
jgi:hypothetical protein